MEIIKDLFGNEIKKKDTINRYELEKMLFHTMSSLSLNEFVKMITNEFNEIIEYATLTNGGTACQKTSLLFNPHRLTTKTKSSKLSIYDALKTESFISGLSRATIFKQNKVNELLYQVLQLGINGIQYVNEFPPHVARDIYLEHKLDANSKILDPCAGWGGRMIGASVISNSYTCFEPSSQTYNGLKKLYDFIKSMNPDFVAKVYNLPYEESNLVNDYYDMALTSPPYYDTEEYIEEQTNSFMRYKTFDLWCDNFYLPLINKTMYALKPSGCFVLNIGSRIYPLNEVLISNFKNKYSIEKINDKLSGKSGLKNNEKEGETFYKIVK